MAGRWCALTLGEVDGLLRTSAVSADELEVLVHAAHTLLDALRARRGGRDWGIDGSRLADLGIDDELRLIVERLSPTDAYFAALTCRRLRDAVFQCFSGLQARNQRVPKRFELELPDVTVSVARLRWVHENLPFSPVALRNDTLVCAWAAASGSLEVLQEARSMKLPWDEATCELASLGGHLDVLQWAHNHGCAWSSTTCREAARRGHLHILQYVRSLPAKERCPWDEETCAGAAKGGKLNVLRWARQRKAPWDENTCLAAAYGGHLDVLIWARQHMCPWPPACTVSITALTRGHLEIFWWAAVNADLGGAAEKIREGIHRLWSVAAAGGHVAVLDFLLETCNSLVPPEQVNTYNRFRLVEEAAQRGHVPVLQWLASHKLLAFHSRVLELASRTGQLQVLDWFYQSDVHVTEVQWRRLHLFAAAQDRLDVLEWAWKHNISWHEQSCRRAILNDNLACLKWLRDHDCPWGKNPLRGELTFNGYHCDRETKAWKWALANGAPLHAACDDEDDDEDDEDDDDQSGFHIASVEDMIAHFF